MNTYQTYVKALKFSYKALYLLIAIGSLLSLSNLNAAELPPVSMHALVIGNSNYANKPLVNPKQDAQLIANTLKQVGFKVRLVNDLDRKAFFANIRDFYNGLPKDSVAFVYYAGHGVQIGGANYLIPVDMTLTSERGVEVNAFPLKAMLDGFTHANSIVNIVVLDACRNNPFQPNNPSKYRNIESMGLAKVVTPKGSIIAYSTAPGQLAEDGLGNKHSLYTSILSDEIKKPGLPIEVVLKKVADTVRKKTFDDQQPWYESSLVDDFYFVPLDGVQVLSPKSSKRPYQDKNIQASRSLEYSYKTSNSDWYMQLSETEWSEFDYEMQQRTKHLTEDEIPMLTKLANKGNVVALTTLGIAYREGLKKIVDVESGKVYRTNTSNKKSLELLTKAAQSGFPIAQTELAEMLYAGKGTDKNLTESVKWLEKASRANYPRAKLNLLHIKIMDNSLTNKESILNLFLKK